ncbi:MAG: ISKra4 family transposase [Lamprocystis purpurea]|uniref:ISKra4 family transposase n=1 Tax=Lamprocystis purpurea TaxID=61598 RepID=UPI000A2EF36B|nr:ISKra4 family transposase [Lamprocystis purpurea]MBV5274583.1 ISKra4 family transposase [Lamprocystis purpurea]
MSTLLPPNDERLLARLNQHPQLRARIERLVDLVEDAGDDLRKADEAERRVIEEVRRLGQEVLEDWADGQVTKRAEELDQTPGVWRDGKKLCWHSTFGDIEVTEPQFREGTRRRRPFAQSAQVEHRNCSLPLQRVLTDLGADLPFAQAAGKLQEHYGVALSPSTIRQVTEGHAQVLFVDSDDEPAWPTQPGVGIVIAETDGGMVPLVEVDPDSPDRRRGKRLLWKEAKLSLAHAHGSTTPVYAATLGGGVAVAGQQLLACAIAAGLGTNTQVHALGDGAVWIADQVAARFGTQGRYTVDFFHVCDDLADAAKRSAPDDPNAWVEIQKKRLKSNQIIPVLAALSEALEPVTVADADAPVRACHRYLSNRLDHLDYQGALAQGLPIGSGEIESAHRYVVQQRLKRPGAWWTPDNAEAMLALRTTRANGKWAAYWQGLVKQAA